MAESNEQFDLRLSDNQLSVLLNQGLRFPPFPMCMACVKSDFPPFFKTVNLFVFVLGCLEILF